MRLSELKAAGIHYQTIARMTEEAALVRVGRGLYELPDGEITESHTLAEVAKAVPRGVICLISALQFHGLTLQLPPKVWIAIGQKDWRPRFDYPPIRVVRFGETAMSMGVERHVIDKVETPIFTPVKTVVDCFRYRNKIGLDVALEALRMSWRSRKASADEIYTYAKALRVWSVMRPYLEATVADEGG